MADLTVDPRGRLAIDGRQLPAVVTRARVRGGALRLDSQQPQEGTGAQHVFHGWEDWTVTLEVDIWEPSNGGSQRWDALDAIRAAARPPEGAPAVYRLSGDLFRAIDLRTAIITSVSPILQSIDADRITCSIALLETDPALGIVQAQSQQAADGQPAAAPATALSLPDVDLLGELEGEGDG